MFLSPWAIIGPSWLLMSIDSQFVDTLPTPEKLSNGVVDRGNSGNQAKSFLLGFPYCIFLLGLCVSGLPLGCVLS